MSLIDSKLSTLCHFFFSDTVHDHCVRLTFFVCIHSNNRHGCLGVKIYFLSIVFMSSNDSRTVRTYIQHIKTNIFWTSLFFLPVLLPCLFKVLCLEKLDPWFKLLVAPVVVVLSVELN